MMRLAAPALLIVISAAAAPAAENEGVALAPLETRLLADAADGRFDSFSLLEAALIAGGAQRGDDIGRYELQMDQLAALAAARLSAQAGPHERAQTAMELLHARLLRGAYSAGCSRVQTTLDSGDYNCVTATILYQALGDRLGLETAAMAAPAHVYSRVLAAEPFDVETTCADWFAIPAEERRQAIRSGWRTRSAAPIDAAALPRAAADASRRQLDPPQLVGKIYYNQGVAMLAERSFAPAVAALQNSLRLDQHDAAARDNLLAAFNNWALDESDHERFEQAAEILAEGAALDPHYEPFQTNDLHIHQKWAQHLCRRHDFAAAIDVLGQGARRRPEAAVLERGQFAVYRAWIDWLLQSDRVAAALDVVETMLAGDPPPAESIALAELAARHVQRLQAAGRNDLADMLLEVGVQRVGPTPAGAGGLTTPAL